MFVWNFIRFMVILAIHYSGQGNGKQAIEIGAGTGKETTPFFNSGYAVTAVEMGVNRCKYD